MDDTTKKKKREEVTPDEDTLRLPLVHAVRSEYYLKPLNNGYSLIPDIQQDVTKYEEEMKRISEMNKK